jgi:phosphoribosylaminoimidazole-succinocarboxamide synthase
MGTIKEDSKLTEIEQKLEARNFLRDLILDYGAQEALVIAVDDQHIVGDAELEEIADQVRTLRKHVRAFLKGRGIIHTSGEE